MTSPTITENFSIFGLEILNVRTQPWKRPAVPLRALIAPAARQTSYHDSKPDGDVACLALQSTHTLYLSHCPVSEMLYF